MRETFANFNKPVRGRRRLLIATLVVLFVCALDIVTGGSLRALVRGVGTRMWTTTDSALSSMEGTGLFSSRRALARRNGELEAEVQKLRTDAAALDPVRSENEMLRKLVHLAAGEQGVTAPVISSVFSSPYDTVLVGAGSEQGIQKDDLVLIDSESSSGSRGGFVVGRIAEVRKRSSVVSLIFAPSAKVEAVAGGATVTVEGRGGSARAEAPRGVPIAVGSVVIAPALHGRAIGTVAKVDADPARAFQTIYIGLPVGLSDVRFVYVVPAAE